MTARCSALFFVLVCWSSVGADEPKKLEQKPESLPAPKDKTPAMTYVEPEMPRRGTREVWQYYGLDSRGRFVPRVMYTPNVSFYLQSGEIYPWTTTRPLLHMPYILD